MTLLYLVGSGAETKAALGAVGALCDGAGVVDCGKLLSAARDPVAAVCPPAQLDEVLRSLQSLGEMASQSPVPLDRRCAKDLGEARRLLRSLPGIGEQRADLLLLQS